MKLMPLVVLNWLIPVLLVFRQNILCFGMEQMDKSQAKYLRCHVTEYSYLVLINATLGVLRYR